MRPFCLTSLATMAHSRLTSSVSSHYDRIHSSCLLHAFFSSHLISSHCPLSIDYILLENLVADLARPCIADVKIGKRTYEENAEPAKVKSMMAKDWASTSHSLGVRLSGMKVCPGHHDRHGSEPCTMKERKSQQSCFSDHFLAWCRHGISPQPSMNHVISNKQKYAAKPDPPLMLACPCFSSLS